MQLAEVSLPFCRRQIRLLSLRKLFGIDIIIINRQIFLQLVLNHCSLYTN